MDPAEQLLRLVPQLRIAAGDFRQAGEHQPAQLATGPGEMVGHLGDGEVEPSGEVAVPRARGVVRRQEVVALEDPESNLPDGADGLTPELFNPVGEEGTHPLAVEPGVRVRCVRRSELSLCPGEVEREMARATPALQSALVPLRLGREVIQTGPQIGAETG